MPSTAASMLDRLLRGRTWILVVGGLLAGIVFFNVGVLDLNRDIARTAERNAELGRENGRLRLRVAHLGSSERIQRAAAARGLVLPQPGAITYLRADPSVDGQRAAERIAVSASGPVAPSNSETAYADASPVPDSPPQGAGSTAAPYPGPVPAAADVDPGLPLGGRGG